MFLGDNVSEVVNYGTNIKIGGEILMGGLSIGLNYLMYTDLTHLDKAFQNINGLLGICCLLTMF